MNILSREFSRNEKVAIVVLAIVLLALAYYWFVFTPVSSGVQEAESEASALEVELSGLESKLASIKRMETELATIEDQGNVSAMGSYNNSKAELKALNDILASTTQYTISFADVTREGDQVRRNFTLQFTVDGYDRAKDVINRLANCEWRCLIDDITCTPSGGTATSWDGAVRVGATATFFETMVGGQPDDGLPAESGNAS